MRWGIFLTLLLLATPGHAQRIEFPKSLETLATMATEKVEIDLDADMLGFAVKILSDSNPEELAAKQLIARLKGIYVRSYRFATDGQFGPAELLEVKQQLVGSAGRPWSKLLLMRGPTAKKLSKPIGPTTSPDNQQIEVWIYPGLAEEARKRRDDTVATLSGSDPAVRTVESMVVLATSAREFTIINVIGPIRPQDFAALGGRLGIPRIDVPVRKDDQ